MCNICGIKLLIHFYMDNRSFIFCVCFCSQVVGNKAWISIASNFHIFRDVKLAKAKGLNNACGFASPSDNVLIVNYMVREMVGVVKDFVVGNFFR